MSQNLSTQYDYILVLKGYIAKLGTSFKEITQIYIIEHLLSSGTPSKALSVKFPKLQMEMGASYLDLIECLVQLVDLEIVEIRDSGYSIMSSKALGHEHNRTMVPMSSIKLLPDFIRALGKVAAKVDGELIPGDPSVGQVEVNETAPDGHSTDGVSVAFDFNRKFNYDYPPHLHFINAIVNYQDSRTPATAEEVLQLEIMRTILFDFNINQPFAGGGQLSIIALVELVIPHRGPSKIRDAVINLVATDFLQVFDNGTVRSYGITSKLLEALTEHGYKSSHTHFASTFLGRPNLVNPSHVHALMFANISKGVSKDTTMSLLAHLYEHGTSSLTFDQQEMSRQEAVQGYQNLVAMEQFGYIKIESTEWTVGAFPLATAASYRMTDEVRHRIHAQS